MPRQSLIKNERFEVIQAKLLALCLDKAGSWAALAREFPISESHLYLLRTGKSKPGPDILCRMLEFSGIIEKLDDLVDKEMHHFAKAKK